MGNACMRITLFSAIMIAIYAGNVFSGSYTCCMLNNQDAKEHRLNDTKNIVHAYGYELYNRSTSTTMLPSCDAFNNAFDTTDTSLKAQLTIAQHSVLYQMLDYTHDYIGLAGIMHTITNYGNASKYESLGEIDSIEKLEKACQRAVLSNDALLIRLCISYIAETVEYTTIGNQYTINLDYDEDKYNVPYIVSPSGFISKIRQASCETLHYSHFKNALNILVTNNRNTYQSTFKDGTPPPIPGYATK